MNRIDRQLYAYFLFNKAHLHVVAHEGKSSAWLFQDAQRDSRDELRPRYGALTADVVGASDGRDATRKDFQLLNATSALAEHHGISLMMIPTDIAWLNDLPRERMIISARNTGDAKELLYAASCCLIVRYRRHGIRGDSPPRHSAYLMKAAGRAMLVSSKACITGFN